MNRSVAFAMIASALFADVSVAKTIEKWNSGEINGFTRYWTTNNVGANFVVWCHPSRQINGTLLHVEINGKTPKPNTRIKLIIDRNVLDLPVNEQGYVDTSCATCADSFGYVWHKLRSARTIAVKFNDLSYAGFSLKGAQQILPGSVCPTDWEKKNS
jgi:hypothetical protein